VDQIEKAKQFTRLHIKGAPLVLYNAWDAGSAKAIADAGAKAVATSSWSIAAAQGYEDGENVPLTFAEQIIERITATVDVPVSADFEGGYSDDDHELSLNFSRLFDLGVIGINFEDRVVHGTGLYSIERQTQRIAALRKAADQKGVPLFINARTDVFLGHGNDINEVLERAVAYASAGASGFFVPGLADDAQIGQVVESSTLPINIMVMDEVSPIKKLAELGVARVSYGPISYIEAINTLKKNAEKAFS
jgi:2-methylisocitrate lyase-like PEP mutase family enzyme